MDLINVVIWNRQAPLQLNITKNTTAEEATVDICKSLGIGPVARYLFCLRSVNGKFWLPASFKIKDAKPNTVFEFRIRYDIPDVNRLRRVDEKAFDFYFVQARNGVIAGKIPEMNYDKYKSEIIGLSVTDMFRAIVEDGVAKEDVVKDYKKFIPNEVFKKHLFFIKKPVVNALNQIKRNERMDALFVKTGYLEQFKKVAPGYLMETFNVLINNADNFLSVFVAVNPFHADMPGIRIRYEGKDEWIHVCTIDDLCYLNIRGDATVEISRRNGIPLYMRFHSLPTMTSFVTLLDGYYRLMVKWTFNLCKDLPSPSLQTLANLKCHGPIDGKFSYMKLEEKRKNRPGCYIIRESDISYDTYYLDVCLKTSCKPVTYKIEKQNGKYRIVGHDNGYPTVGHLLADYKSEKNGIRLTECLPPSEFDQSNLLLCQTENKANARAATENTVWTNPVCIDSRTLMVFKSMGKSGKCAATTVYKSVWCHDGSGQKQNVAIKMLNEQHRQEHLSEFLSLTSRWAFVTSSAVVKLFGVTLANPISMVMEYLPAGPLDMYLRENRMALREVDLVEASTYLANALWYLEEAGFVHGNIRCRKLMVAAHTDNSFVTKLADPGLCTGLEDGDLHWIPPEFHGDLMKARSSVMADVWAFGTTLWEIFSYGRAPPDGDGKTVRNFYKGKRHLPQPAGCPGAVFQLMLECWSYDPHSRKKPQAAMRDINQILYQVYNARHDHSYCAIIPSHDSQQDSVSNKSKGSDDLNSSLFSELTLNTFLDEGDESSTINNLIRDHSDITDMEDMLLRENSSLSSSFADYCNRNSGSRVYKCTTDKDEMLAIVSQNNAAAFNSICSMQSIFELDKEWNLILTGRIGEGFYGEVYRGRLEHTHDKKEQLVAVKKMKNHAVNSTTQADFDREITIMLKLEHPNIVRIIGVVRDPELCLVLEYIEHGSLQCYLKIHRDRLTAHHLLKFALDVAKGMTYLGQKNLVHRDLAARNILVVNEFYVKISDFGLARFTGTGDYYIYQTERDLPLKWYAPESIQYGKFSHQSDVWSYGVTLYEMFSYGEDPKLPLQGSQTPEKICESLKAGIRLPCPKTCPQYVYANVMAPCWKYAAKDRPLFHQLGGVIEKIFNPPEENS